MRIDVAQDSDRADVLAVERVAFGEEDEAELVANLLDDPSARPVLSLLARDDEGRAIGHILYTAAYVADDAQETTCALLAPLAVVPDAQDQGVGGALIEYGLQLLTAAGTDIVFVLGHPGYYPRHGFEPAGRLGLDAPYLIPEKDAGAWMLRALRPGIVGAVSGVVRVADALMKPEYWRE